MPELYQVEEGWFETYTGKQFHFMDPQPEEIDVIDIAHALSMQCRYNGHTKVFYSVAEHSVLICDWLTQHGYGPQVALTGLLHDAAEAYIGDVVCPLKHVMPDFKALEKVLDVAVARKFGTLYPFPEVVKALDSRILRDERVQVMNESDNSWGTDDLEPLGVTIRGRDPLIIRHVFRSRFSSLRARLWDLEQDTASTISITKGQTRP